VSSDLDTARTVRSWLRSQPDEPAGRLIEAALAEAVTTPQERARWATARFSLANPVVIASIVATITLVVLGGYQFLIAPNVGNPIPPGGTPSQSAEPRPSEPSAESTPLPPLPVPSGMPDPCTLLPPESVLAVLPPREQPLRGELVRAPGDPDRVFCAYFTGDVWLTNFWIFYDLADWPTDPRSRAEAVLHRYGLESAEIEEVAIGDAVAWVGRRSAVVADDRFIYLIRMGTSEAARELAGIVIGNLEAMETPGAAP
jgi:hypothetical protein